MFHTFEQAKLKPVQDLIWKRFLTNRVEHQDGRVFVTSKDARLPKLGGPVSLKAFTHYETVSRRRSGSHTARRTCR